MDRVDRPRHQPERRSGFGVERRRGVSGYRKIGIDPAAGGGVDAESSAMRPETRFNLLRGAIFGYRRARFGESSGECRLTIVNSNS